MASEITTPESHQNYDMEIPEMTKERVRDADPNGGRCLVTNTMTPLAIHYCRCIPRRFMNHEKILDSLEWAWKMRRYSLDLDTHYNIFCVDISLRILFDQHRSWLLMPEDEILEKYRRSMVFVGGQYFAQREHFPNFPERKTFFYKLVPLQGLEGLPILRQDVIPDGNLSPEHGSIHVYPFNSLPLLKSHIHPKYVIFDTGSKLAESEQDVIQELEDVFPTLHFSSIMALYSAWIRSPPAKSKKDHSYNVPDDKKDDVRTKSEQPRPNKRKLAVVEDEEYRTPPPVWPRPKKRKHIC